MITLMEAVRILKPLDFYIRHNRVIDGLLTDSRSAAPSAHTLFIALVTPSGNGHRYIGELYNRGLRNFLISEPPENYRELYPEADFLVVEDTLTALQTLAAHKRSQYSYPVVGITGSNGKTIVKEFLYQLLHDRYHIVRSPKSYNSQLGVPLSVWKMSRHHNLAIFEAGISKPGEMSRLQPIIRPTHVILTGIGSAHQENFGSIQEKLQEKLQLAREAQYLIYNADDNTIASVLRDMRLSASPFCYSRHNAEADVFISKEEIRLHGTYIELICHARTHTIEIPFTDRASIENVLHCVTLMGLLCPEMQEAGELFRALKPVEMRLELQNGYHNNSIINDSYSNDLMSLEVALDFQQRRCRANGADSVVILSDIYESGMPASELYDRVHNLLVRYGVHRFWGIGEEITASRSAFDGIHATFHPNIGALVASGLPDELHNSCILIKGARRFGFEALSDRLVRQQHQTVLEVDLTAIRQNLAHYRAMLPTDCKMVCMIKAEGYGLGSFEMARTLQESHADYLAVAVADEGKKLRHMGIHCPIIVMNPEENSWDTLIENGLQPEIYSLSLLRSLCEVLHRKGQTEPFDIHIKCDSGMHRLGFMPRETDTLAEYLHHHPEVRVASIFSHLAAADNPALDAFTLRQIDTYRNMAQHLTDLLGYKPLWHILNTAGITRFAHHHFDMVRLGLGLYGIDPVTNHTIHPAVKLTTTILQIKELPAGEYVGYSCHGEMKQAGRIAIIPIGYADGFSRRLGNGALQIYIDGVPCPTIGNICMDTCMIDITALPHLTEGTRITLFGNDEVPLQRLSDIMGTIPYEVLTGLSPRIPRLYFQA